MRNCRWRALVCLATLWVILLPALAAAQVSGSGIAGVVKDTSGAVLPGVSVEAASPALIEKVRVAVTDGQGQYKIVDLRPGVYTVTFALPGFTTLKREGIELNASFTAAVNAELAVATLAETVTVSGETPIVDVQNVVQQRVVTAEVIANIPTGRSMANLAAVVPGLNVVGGRRPSPQDVGGSVGGSLQSLASHGGRIGDQVEWNEGLPNASMNGLNTGGIAANTGALQEFSYQFGALSAEAPTGGVQIQHVPKDGGNVFSGSMYATYANHNTQSDNFTDRIKATGLTSINHMQKVFDVNPSFGGPIKRDTLWFFGSVRYWGYREQVAGVYWPKDINALVYSPDLSRPAVDDSWFSDITARLTWQATPKNKINMTAISQSRCVCYEARPAGALATPEATIHQVTPLDYVYRVTWNAPATNRLLFEGGISTLPYQNPRRFQSFTPPDALSIMDSTGLIYHAPPGGFDAIYDSTFWASRAAVSYVTGSHAAKVGYLMRAGHRRNGQKINGYLPLTLTLRNGVPSSVSEYWAPRYEIDNLNAAVGVYAQDQWTVKRWTLNGGLRYDYQNASVPAQHLDATPFVGARDFAAVSNVPNWKDLSPRLGASWDVFGNGKTAIKGTLGRFVASETLAFADNNNPVTTSVVSANRTWQDLNGNFLPDCDFSNTAANGECGGLGNLNFGKNNPNANRYDDALKHGWGVRGYNWEFSAGIQHEILPRVSVNVSYFRRWYGNFTVTNNLATTAADYDQYCITAPTDSRLSGGGGYPICGLYDVTPAKFGQVNNLITFASNYGLQWEHYNGVDITMTARLPRGALVQGGLNAGRTETNNCGVVLGNPQLANPSPASASVTLPRTTAYCDIKAALNPSIKFLGTYPLPKDFQVAATFQSLVGPTVLGTYAATNTDIRPSLGRNLAAGANGTAAIDLLAPETRYVERLYQVDLRLAKIIKVGRTRIHLNLDAYNSLNKDTILVVNNNYSPLSSTSLPWLQPRYILPGRLFKFDVQVDF